MPVAWYHTRWNQGHRGLPEDRKKEIEPIFLDKVVR